MKKLMLCVMLMVLSFTLNAATISIGNPTVTAAGLFSPKVTNTYLSSTLRIDNIKSGYLFGGPVSVAWDLAATKDSRFSLGMFGNGTYGMHGSLFKGPWTVSVLDGEGTVLKSGILGSVFDDLVLKTGDTITAVVSGTIRLIGSKSFTTGLFLTNVTETPLPAAVWLFGSVLLGGLAMRRRKAKQMPVAA